MWSRMGEFKIIEQKLEGYIRRYNLNLILKGSLLFLGIGLLYFLVVAIAENFLWFSTEARRFIFWFFILSEIVLLIYFVGIPLSRLLNLSKGISRERAADLIGIYFPEIKDKLKNLLQLNDQNAANNELILASIHQKSKDLRSVNFGKAINYRENRKFLQILIVPVAIILLLFIAGRAEWIGNGFKRLSDYETVYLKPAPFEFILNTESLKVQQGKTFILDVRTTGEIVPEDAEILINDEPAFMRKIEPGHFQYVFQNTTEDQDFRIRSGEVLSRKYVLNVLETPVITDFVMNLQYPAYLDRADEIISGTGNATLPEGTVVNWNLKAENTSRAKFAFSDSIYNLEGNQLQKRIRKDENYAVSTSNSNFQDFETMNYQIDVIKDQYPKINVVSKRDSISESIQYLRGEVSDDYGLTRLRLVYYKANKKDSLQFEKLDLNRDVFGSFMFVFPGNLNLEEGNDYRYYFEVFDNDGVNGNKSSRSSEFGYYKATNSEAEDSRLKDQKETIDNLQDEMKRSERSDEEFEEMFRIAKENEQLNYDQQQKMKDFVKRQKQHQDMMKNFGEQLQKNLEQSEGDRDSEELQNRLDNTLENIEKNEDLLKQLEEYSDKIKSEELSDKVDELSKKNKVTERSLEQVLELTKRYYVREKNEKISNDLEQLGEKQEQLGEKENKNLEEQEKLTEDFDKIQDDLEELNNENENLEKPMDLEDTKGKEESIKNDQEDAQKDIQKQDNKSAGEKQKSAGEKMKEMSQQMKRSQQMSSQQSLKADAASLRQILDNLITFSFEQEDLLKNFQKIQINSPSYASKLKVQNNLKENFQHVDDSLYALALKNPMISEQITSKLADVDFDINKSLERLAENEIPQGTASQQYVVTGSNELAAMLSDVLSQMQEAMGEPGSGKGGDFQLPDIIKGQEQIQESMEKGMQQDKQGKPQEGGESQQRQGDGDMNGELFEIYKQQQELRRKMEDYLKKKGMNGAEVLSEKMEEVEEDILNKGFSNETLEKIKNLNYELMKYDEAEKKQGLKNDRLSETNDREYQNTVQEQLDNAREYFNSTEILNRQNLPLRQIYKKKVREYFGSGN